MWKHSIVHLTNTDFTLEKGVINFIVQFFPRCKFFPHLFGTDYHTLLYPKTREIKSCRCSHTCNSIDSFSSSSESMVSAVGIPFVSGSVMHSRPASNALPPIMAYGRSGCTRRCGKKKNSKKLFSGLPIFTHFCVLFESAQRSIVELDRHYFKLYIMAH